jgi:hypothetical protein
MSSHYKAQPAGRGNAIASRGLTLARSLIAVEEPKPVTVKVRLLTGSPLTISSAAEAPLKSEHATTSKATTTDC